MRHDRKSGKMVVQMIASGEKTKSELLGLGDHEYVPWNIGVTG